MSDRIRLDAITFDAGTQIRAAISEAVVTEYAERMSEGVTFPPVVLFHDGNRHYMADGFHRGLASQRVGFVDIEADVRPGTKADALWFALGANKANGYQMTEADKRSAVLVALRTWPDKSGRMLADQIGCSAQLVSLVKSGLSSPDDPPTRVVTRTGGSYPASPSAAVKARQQATQMLTSGSSPEDVQRTTGIGRDTLNELRRTLGLSVDKTKAGVQQRRDQMRTMATEGHSSKQIAQAIGVTEENCRAYLRTAGIDVPADRVTRGTHRHDSTRIIEHMVMDAENLTADVGLIEFSDLDPERLPAWLDSLKASRDNLSGFIRRLMEERKKHVEAA